jgi:AcrR family transcriptional regulator
MNTSDAGSEAPAASPKRPRNAAATREAILRSALIAFTRSGYDGVGVREIAQAAGVTAMLVNRYFGSKERLFAEVVETAFAEPTLLSDDVTSLSRDVAAALVAQTEPAGESVDGFLLMLRSASNPRAAELLRDSIDRHFEHYLAALLPGAEANERAGLFLCLIAGFQLLRNVLGSRALARGDPAVLARRLEALFQSLVEPGPDRRAASRKPARRPSQP